MSKDLGASSADAADRVTDERSREGASPPSGSVPTGAGAFTPAPWRFDGRNLVGGNGERVVFSGHIGLAIGPRPHGWPNDNLLLAAPDLYAAVQALVNAIDYPNGRDAAYVQGRAALAKARGDA